MTLVFVICGLLLTVAIIAVKIFLVVLICKWIWRRGWNALANDHEALEDALAELDDAQADADRKEAERAARRAVRSSNPTTAAPSAAPASPGAWNPVQPK